MKGHSPAIAAALIFAPLLAIGARSSVGPDVFGSTPALRVIEYAEPSARFHRADRRAIQDAESRLVTFYGRYGLKITFESDIRRFQGTYHAFGRGGPEKAYWTIHDELKHAGLLLPGRTIVFAPFDVGLTGDMSLVRINDSDVGSRECPTRYDGERPWWCGRSTDELWGGVLHEVGHLFGLKHFRSGDAAARSSIMGNFKRYATDPSVGLNENEIQILKRKFGSRKGAEDEAPIEQKD